MMWKNRSLNTWVRAGLLTILILSCSSSGTRADVAPPESPPGVVISPGNESTQVRMVSEKVTLIVISSGEQIGKAKTQAAFVMRNLGSSEEDISVRFPLTFGEALYYTNVYPEISDLKVEVENQSVPTTRTTSVDKTSGSTIPWANFPVKFPPGQDINISVTYTAQGFGYEPFLSFRYILETGAAWKDTIGSGDIIVLLPYDANQQNVLIDNTSGFSKAANAPVFSGNEISWHFENLEPTQFENFEVELISPSYWKRVLSERNNTNKNPQDGEAWGRLGKAIKESIRFPKGYLREDDGGKELYQEAVLAYGKAVTLLPKDALWHYGYADLLWSHYLFSVFYSGTQDYSELTKLSDEIRISLLLDPNNQNTKDLALWISGTIPWAIQGSDKGFDYPVLTATPTYAPETVTPEIGGTPLSETTPTTELPTIGIVDTTAPLIEETPSKTLMPSPTQETQKGKIPFCGSILVFPILIGLGYYLSKPR